MAATMLRAGTLAWISLILLLSGCTRHLVEPEDVIATRSLAPRFMLEGRIAASDQERASSGAISWTHAPGRNEWQALSPTGQIVARLTETASGAELVLANGDRHHAEHAGALLPSVLGVSAPVSNFTYWVQAIAPEGARVLRRDQAGRPALISDSGWLIEFGRYQSPAPDAPPRRLEATWGDKRVLLIIDQWTPIP